MAAEINPVLSKPFNSLRVYGPRPNSGLEVLEAFGIHCNADEGFSFPLFLNTGAGHERVSERVSPDNLQFSIFVSLANYNLSGRFFRQKLPYGAGPFSR